MIKTNNIKDHFKKVDQIIYQHIKVIDFSAWIKPTPPNTYFKRLCREIIGQQLSDKSSAPIFKRFTKLFGRKKISPDLVLNLSNQTLRGTGMSWSKAGYIKNIAESFKKNSKLMKLNELEDELVVEELIKIKGIGRWTVEMFLIFTLGREDVFSHGDLGLNRAIVKLYQLKKPTVKKVESITKPWSPYRSYGSIALWHSLDIEK